jgi:hypothetical protein
LGPGLTERTSATFYIQLWRFIQNCGKYTKLGIYLQCTFMFLQCYPTDGNWPLGRRKRFDANINVTCHNRRQKTRPTYSGELTPQQGNRDQEYDFLLSQSRACEPSEHFLTGSPFQNAKARLRGRSRRIAVTLSQTGATFACATAHMPCGAAQRARPEY